MSIFFGTKQKGRKDKPFFPSDSGMRSGAYADDQLPGNFLMLPINNMLYGIFFI